MTTIQITAFPRLDQLDLSHEYTFEQPVKKINEGEDVKFFLTSKAYRDLVTFILQLNGSMFPRQVESNNEAQKSIKVWEIGSKDYTLSESVERLAVLLQKAEELINEAPPDTGPRRFGNVSFRKWYSLLEERIDEFLEEAIILPSSTNGTGMMKAKEELRAYFLGSFGSAQRLDYGTGHELSFIAFLAGIWKLNGFSVEPLKDSIEERSIVFGVFNSYLILVRRIIKTYSLEPAGSHGVWGLDDHSFLPYMFGSAQYAPPIKDVHHIPMEGSLKTAPDPGDVTKITIVEKLRSQNLYFGAIGFIHDVKKGPFWEHSPMLFDISGVKAGWAKINKGMIKMYMAEVLSKFPVVQHFPFGGLFRWEKDPDSVPLPTTAHVSSQPSKNHTSRVKEYAAREFSNPQPRQNPSNATAAPWGKNLSTLPGTVSTTQIPSTTAPWARAPDSRPVQESNSSGRNTLPDGMTLNDGGQIKSSNDLPMAPTKAPWAK